MGSQNINMALTCQTYVNKSFHYFIYILYIYIYIYIYFTHINTVVSVVNTELNLKVKRTMLMMFSIDLA